MTSSSLNVPKECSFRLQVKVSYTCCFNDVLCTANVKYDNYGTCDRSLVPSKENSNKIIINRRLFQL